LSTINGYLRLSSNNALTNISALSNLTSINGYLRINLNSHLTNLNGLLGLTSIAGELNLTSNVLLTNIDALENINPASINNLILQSNGTLALCEISSVCAYLNNPSNTATIASNASNCASRLAVENACLLVLPVELISFTAASSGTNVKLIWTTARELNNDHFEIERSADGIQFEIIGSVSGSNAKKTIRKYEYIDVNPHEIVNYYRLKQIDSNGKFQYSNIISAKIQSEKEIDVYPNPALNELIIANNTENSSYFIRNSIGQICQKGILHPDEVIDLSTIASGLYFLELEGKMIRFVKE
ncbi:MAG: T9SS type A sorting domain-containing protein, partial [Saprospiraceae bacterium]